MRGPKGLATCHGQLYRRNVAAAHFCPCLSPKNPNSGASPQLQDCMHTSEVWVSERTK